MRLRFRTLRVAIRNEEPPKHIMKSYQKNRHFKLFTVLFAAIGFVTLGWLPAAADQKSDIHEYHPAGDIGALLPPGTFYPPLEAGDGRLKRKKDSLEVEINTSGLPAGAYNLWWVIFNNPENCDGPCNPPDLFNPAVEGSVFFATSGIVEDEGDGLGSGLFRDVHFVGEYRGAKGIQDIIPIDDPGAPIDPKNAEVRILILYHGPVSDDPYTLHDQLTTFLGSCVEGGEANAFPSPLFGVQCFGPQAVFFPPPGKGNKGKD